MSEANVLPMPPKDEQKPKLHLIQKLAACVREIDHVEKSGRNTFQNYNYVKAADVAWLVRKALSERNIYLVSDVVDVRNYEIPAKEGAVMQAVDVKLQFSFFDGDDPKEPPIVLHAYGTGTDKGDKAIYKAMTGALKYGLRHAFLIPDESDPEGDTSTDKATGSREAAQAVAQRKIAEHADKTRTSQDTFESGKAHQEARTGNHVPAIFYSWFDESQTARIEGDKALMSANKDILAPLWNATAGAVVADADQLESLKYQFGERNVNFKLLKSTESIETQLKKSIEHAKAKKA